MEIPSPPNSTVRRDPTSRVAEYMELPRRPRSEQPHDDPPRVPAWWADIQGRLTSKPDCGKSHSFAADSHAAALINRRCLGLAPIKIRTDLPYTARFYHTALAESESSPAPDPQRLAVLDMLELLHSDHGQNCSSSAVQLVGSGRASIFASIAAGINQFA